VNPQRVRRLLRLLGLEALYPKPRTSTPASGQRIYPSLLRAVPITHADQVWSSDIIYVRLARGWIYLVAILDWYSRYVLAWEASNTLDSAFCVSALERALIQRTTPRLFVEIYGTRQRDVQCNHYYCVWHPPASRARWRRLRLRSGR
jgi:putative transposase